MKLLKFVLFALILIHMAFSLDLAIDHFATEIFKAERKDNRAHNWRDQKMIVFSSTSEKIPNQIPGPSTQWSGSESKGILLNINKHSPFKLSFQFIDSHETNPPLISIDVDGEFIHKFQIPPGNGLQEKQWLKHGKRFNYDFFLNQGKNKNGIRKIHIQNIKGSWVAMDSISIKSIVPLWRYLACLLGWLIFLVLTCSYIYINRNQSQRHGNAIVLLICFLNLIFYVPYYFSSAEFIDEAVFGGDTWEYQSMGVNFAYNHGLNRFGAAENFSVYKFPHDSEKRSYYPSFMNGQIGGRPSFLRTPAYPIFIGLVYKVYDVSPQKLKYIQLFLIICVAAFLPYLGFHYGGWKLAVGSILAGYLFLNTWAYDLSRLVMTEPLITFVIFITLISFALYEKKPNVPRALLFGILLGLNPLTKGSLIFAPPLFLLLMAFKCSKVPTDIARESLFATLKHRASVNKKHLFTTVVGFSIFTLPWSAFATFHAGEFVAFSQQTASILLTSHNEFALDGGWHPEGLSKAAGDVFYLRDDVKDLSTIERVFAFYNSHSYMIPEIFINKLNRGFDRFTWFKLLLILVIFQAMFHSKVLFRKWGGSALAYYIIVGTGLIILVSSYLYHKFLTGDFYISSSRLIFVSIIFVLLSLLVNKKYTLSASLPCMIYVLNIILVTLITYGYVRFVKVFSFVFILLSFQYFIAITNKCVELISRRINHLVH